MEKVLTMLPPDGEDDCGTAGCQKSTDWVRSVVVCRSVAMARRRSQVSSRVSGTAPDWIASGGGAQSQASFRKRDEVTRHVHLHGRIISMRRPVLGGDPGLVGVDGGEQQHHRRQ